MKPQELLDSLKEQRKAQIGDIENTSNAIYSDIDDFESALAHGTEVTILEYEHSSDLTLKEILEQHRQEFDEQATKARTIILRIIPDKDYELGIDELIDLTDSIAPLDVDICWSMEPRKESTQKKALIIYIVK